MIPLIVGVGYEFIRYAGGHSNIFTKIVSAPGLWMQRITTREPDDSQLEVALAALKNAIPVEFGGVVQPSCKLDAHGGIVTENEEEPDAADTDDAGKELEEGADGAEGALPTEGAVDTNDPNTDSAEHDA
jgi:hypothetical protein